MRPTMFQLIWPSGFRGDDFSYQSTNLQQEMSAVAMFVNGSFIYTTYQVSVHLVKRLQRRIFFEIDQSETRIAFGRQVC